MSITSRALAWQRRGTLNEGGLRPPGRGDGMKRLYSCVPLVAVLALAVPTAHGTEVNNATITCGAFLVGTGQYGSADQLATRVSRRQDWCNPLSSTGRVWRQARLLLQSAPLGEPNRNL